MVRSGEMREVGVLEAKTNLSALIDAVQSGEEVMITRHGKPVARLVPAAASGRRPGPDSAVRIRSLRDEIARKHGIDAEFDWKAAVEEGRR
jgi:prevent-host-death family protein